ncbi:MAG TPA: hypothetical protein VH229_06330 [Candidatus Udaeobacter sp.]|jgi:hypothetical protein|nr:hypothetical protein [Candidatus Udaeobacter sp.]
MKITSLKQICSSALIVMAALTVAFSFASAQAPERPMHPERTIQGVWRTMVTPVNCQTGDPLAPPFRSLLTFNMGGTMSEYGIGPGSSPALRSPGHGVWQREHGWQDYSYTFTFYRYDASGAFIGSQKVTSVLELGASGDEFTTHAAGEILDANDNVIATFCVRAAGTRFE